MAILQQETFDGLADLTVITTANTTFDVVTDNGLTATTTNPIHGTASMDIATANGTDTARWDVGGRTELFSRIYLRRTGTPGNDNWVAGIGNAADDRAWVVALRTDGAISALDSADSGGVDVSTAILAVGDVVRIEHHVDITAGTIEVRLFYGVNVEGTIPDETLAPDATPMADMATWRVGCILNRDTPAVVDSVAIGDDWIGPQAGGGGDTTTADPLPVEVDFGAPTVQAAYSTTAEPLTVAIDLATPAAVAAYTRQAGPLAVDVAYGVPAVSGASQTVAQPLAVAVAFGPPAAAAAYSTTAKPLTVEVDLDPPTVTGEQSVVNLHFIALAPELGHGPALAPEVTDRTALAPELAHATAGALETVDRSAGRPELGHGAAGTPELGHGNPEVELGHGNPGEPEL